MLMMTRCSLIALLSTGMVLVLSLWLFVAMPAVDLLQ